MIASCGSDALAFGGADDEVCDPRRMILRRDGDFAHASAHGATGIADGGAEQFRQGDEWTSPDRPGDCSACGLDRSEQ